MTIRTIRLNNITATPHPCGNRIDLNWENPDPGLVVLVRRGEGTYPASSKDGVLVAEGEGLNSVKDEGLKGEGLKGEGLRGEGLKAETVYYYTLFPHKPDESPDDCFDYHNRVSAMATAPYDMAGQMYALLPGIYHRYDRILPKGDWPAEDKQKGQLRRFLDIPGSQLDQIYSMSRAMLDLYDLDKTDGSLLRLLAQWIGLPVGSRLAIADQRKEIGNAPYLYRTTGIIPTVEATIKRLIGWESRTREFVHNIFRSNSPERLNLWACKRDSKTGEWSKPEKPLSLDFAYEGRPTLARDGEGTLWLFYHASKKRYDLAQKKRKDTWDIRYKTLRKDQQEWSPSQPLTGGVTFDRHPSAVVQAGKLWVFWDTWDETDRTWRINYLTRTDEKWSSIQNFGFFGATSDWVLFHSWSGQQYPDHRTVDFTKTPIVTRFRTWHMESQRRMPWAVVDKNVDRNDGLWLFWLEKIKGEGTWQLKYNRHTGTGWALQPDAAFPLDKGKDSLEKGKDPRVESDLFVLSHREKIWVFWARKEYSGGPWEIAYRVKEGMDPNASDWSEIHILPKSESNPGLSKSKANPGWHDREPVAFVNKDDEDEIELFWSSSQNGSMSVWHGILKDRILKDGLDETKTGRESAKQITDNLYSQRDPLPLSINGETGNGETWLMYRSNESLTYTSETYRSTKTIDARYAGSTTVVPLDLAKIAMMRQFTDFQTYTYDIGRNGKRSEDDWYARDTVGIYLSSRTDDSGKINYSRQLVENVLKQFLPVQMRAVFIIEPSVISAEPVYTRERLIREESFAEMRGSREEYSGPREGYREDTAGDWAWLYSWSVKYPDHHTVDFNTTPIHITLRTWYIGLTPGE